MSDEFHESGFDESTQLKLEIFKRYLKEWLPVFISAPIKGAWTGDINVFDFFSGPGHDIEGNEGSPILALRTCLEYSNLCFSQNKRINLYFNDVDPEKINTLQAYISTIAIPSAIHIHFSTEAFAENLSRRLIAMRSSPNLLFIDQYGVKEVTMDVFQLIAQINITDILFFISSWHAVRFKDHEAFKPYIKLSPTGKISFKDAHRAIAAYFRQQLPKDLTYFLAPFSLKKKSSIHGLIFGSKNLLGIDKFLKIAWALDPRCGESNYDIDDEGFPDNKAPTGDLFASIMIAKKIDAFQAELKLGLIEGRFNYDRDVYSYTLGSGFLPVTHAKPVIVELIKSGVLTCEGQPRLSDSCIKEPRKITRLP